MAQKKALLNLAHIFIVLLLVSHTFKPYWTKTVSSGAIFGIPKCSCRRNHQSGKGGGGGGGATGSENKMAAVRAARVLLVAQQQEMHADACTATDKDEEKLGMEE